MRVLTILLALCLPLFSIEKLNCDLLIVGGTESGCASAVQAARMGIGKIIIVNDTDWLGGQFSSEALVAIDESRGPSGYDQTVPFPRNGAFLDIINYLEKVNLEKHGVPRPGNTRVITTTTPKDAHIAFQRWLSPYVEKGQIEIINNAYVESAEVKDSKLLSVSFKSPNKTFTVKAQVTIDASDWGEVIKASGAAFEFGPDLYETYKEPLAPKTREGYPLTDMNPITYCMVLTEADEEAIIPKPKNYNPDNYRKHKYPKDTDWLYRSRRLVDSRKFPSAKNDSILLCFPAFDYPLDVYTADVVRKLEATEPGASKKNIAIMTREQRQIVFDDAKEHSLGFLYYLQTEAYDSKKENNFRKMKLYSEFLTKDKLPPKPYVRESLRIKARYMLKQQDTVPAGESKFNFSKIMFHDSVFSWQFEYDFHPTKRQFLKEGNEGPWLAVFRKGRTWGPPYSGKSNFPLRSLIPEKIEDLIAGQKNLGYTSIVSSAIRLHDQSMAVGQACGGTGAIAILNGIALHEIPYNRKVLIALQTALATTDESGAGISLWPYSDLAPDHPAFTAANLLSVQNCLPIKADSVKAELDKKLEPKWAMKVIAMTLTQLEDKPDLSKLPLSVSKGEFLLNLWNKVKALKWKAYPTDSSQDFDGDGVLNKFDPMPLNEKKESF
ncbi:MAG: FAD-dependent oxidoreductase [Lentisphaeraceae bacterium]|nr:FAD-dependent oxidoreductase [Lentisphaeraceae bacterium]